MDPFVDRIVRLVSVQLRPASGQVPEAFLRGCGWAHWEIEKIRSRGPELTQDEVEQIQAERSHPPKDQSPFMGGIFIAYAHQDAAFVHKLEKPLLEAGIPVWCDEHNDDDDPMRPEAVRQFNHTRPETLPDLSKANLSEAKLYNVNLSEANLRGAKIRRAELYRADLRGADLRETDLRGSKLSVANLRRARLNQSDLRTAVLRWADLRGAVLSGSKLDRADLTGANLIWSDLYGTQLNETILNKADLRWARFGDTSVTCGLSHTKGLNETIHWGPSHLSTHTHSR